MKLKNIAKNSLFAKSFWLAKSNPGKTGLMVLFDILFLVSVYSLYRLNLIFAKSIIIEKSLSSIFIFLVFSLIYYLIILFVYSFFKYSILDFIKSLFEKTEFSFKRLGQFYLLNIIIAGILFVASIIAGYILVSIKESYRPFLYFLIASPYWVVINIYSIFSIHSLISYIFVNLSHSEFYEGDSIKTAIKKSFTTTFAKIRSYRETISIMILFALALWLLFLGSGYLIRLFTSKNYGLYLITYAYFKQASIIIFDIVFYLVILINRISFYSVMKENKS